MRCRSTKARGGFTIVELLVAAGVSLLLMVIITEAFKRGIDMFRSMRTQGVMQERLRTAGTMLRDDLAAFRFPETAPYQYVSDQTTDRFPVAWEPPKKTTGGGYFRIFQGPMDPLTNNPFVAEGTDRDGMLFARATTHTLQFTVLRLDFNKVNKGATPENMFRVLENPQPVPPGMLFPNNFVDPNDYVKTPAFGTTPFFTTRYAEVSYFLVPNNDFAGATQPNPTQLFNLCRRQRLLIDPKFSGTAVPANSNAEISTRYTSPPIYNNMADMSEPRNRFGMVPSISGGPYPTLATDPNIAGLPDTAGLVDSSLTGLAKGDDIILSDVISFEVKAMWTPIVTGNPAIDDPGPLPAYNVPGSFIMPGLPSPVANSDYPFDYLPLSKRNSVFSTRQMRVFDTWSADPPYDTWNDTANAAIAGTRIPLRINLKAVLIRIRIWDPKAEQARQLTIIQDL